MNGSTLEYRFASVPPTEWTKLYTLTGSDGDGGAGLPGKDGADGNVAYKKSPRRIPQAQPRQTRRFRRQSLA